MTPSLGSTILVTGAAGFVGGHLVRHLLALDAAPARLVALDLARGPDLPGLEWVVCDLADPAAVRDAVAQAAPDAIVHLAAVTHGDDLAVYFAANVVAGQNVLAAAAGLPRPPRVLVVGSAAQYGITSGEYEVVEEDRPLLARTPYGVSKILQERWALLWAEARGLPVVCVRPFNITGPGQPPSLVPAAFLEQLADVLDGRADAVRVGNTESCRDFTDVRDVVAAMAALLAASEEVQGRVFNIASGEAVRIGDILQECIRLGGGDVRVEVNPARIRRHDVPVIVGDASRLRAATGWAPEVSWRRSLEDTWHAIREARGA